MSEWKAIQLERKYADFPIELRYKKKKKKIHIKSNHKHRYASAIFDSGYYRTVNGIKEPMYYIGTYCVICGRIDDINIGGNVSNPNLPVFKNVDLFAKRINLEDISAN